MAQRAAAFAPAPHLALGEDKEGNTSNQRRRPNDDAHANEPKEANDMLLVDSAQAFLKLERQIPGLLPELLIWREASRHDTITR
jgi:hypothetical protein